MRVSVRSPLKVKGEVPLPTKPDLVSIASAIRMIRSASSVSVTLHMTETTYLFLPTSKRTLCVALRRHWRAGFRKVLVASFGHGLLVVGLNAVLPS